jgi:GTP-binding protein EngB required for normal cell division
MTDMTDDMPKHEDEDENRLPRVALMGEFSAGKSTLTNLLLAADPLPVKITATRLPPVWITLGEGAGMREDKEGQVHPLGPDGLNGVEMEDTRLIQLQMQSDILHICDLVDMPGISDPNMDSSVWSGVINQADLVIWCTHATQAWRQSEAATYDGLPKHLQKNAILLITRFDKLHSERDRKRVLARVKAETKGRFRAIFPVSLLDALASGEDRAKLDRSGAEPFLKALLELLTNPDAVLAPDEPAQKTPEPPKAEVRPITPVRPMRVKAAGQTTPRPGRPQPSGRHGAVGHG